MWFHLFGFGIGERQKRLELIDDGLRAAGAHPAVFPEAVKLTLLRLKKEALAQAGPQGEAGRETGGEAELLAEAAWLLAYCYLGPKEFAEIHGEARAEELAKRLAAAEAAPRGGDAELVMLALTANLADPAVAERFEVETD